jgi:hypothetical protein
MTYSRPTSLAFLSSRSATHFECRRWLSGVHSVNSNWPTSTGFNQRHSFILGAVIPLLDQISLGEETIDHSCSEFTPCKIAKS